MSFSDFTLKRIENDFGIVSQTADLHAQARPVPVPAWLEDQLKRGLQLPLLSEKARGELIVMPVLLACREMSGGTITIFSGARMDVDPSVGLVGECDFLLARTDPVPFVRSPFVAIVEAKKGDIEAGLGQCVAQMIGARMLNEQDGRGSNAIHGCVTTGEDWQFLRLDGSVAAIDRRRYYFNDLPGILGVFRVILSPAS